MMQFGDARLPERFWQGAVPEPNSGCWLWSKGANGAGYGMVTISGKWGLAHRYAFIALQGGVPVGLELDHLCRTPLCCNPSHLEAVTHRVNMLRGATPAAAHARKTHCCHGHEYTPENTWVSSRGRSCRACRRSYQATKSQEQKDKDREYKRAWKKRQRAHRTAV